MIHWMRTHRKKILVGIVITVVPTFIVWGGYRSSANRRAAAKEGPAKVAAVAGVPIYRQEYQNALNQEIEREGKYGKRPTLKDLASNGQAEKTLDELINTALLGQEAQKSGFRFSREYMVEKLKQDEMFKDDKGNFIPGKWNGFLEADPRRNWNDLYDHLQSQIARQLIVKQIMAPARVLDSDLRKQFEDNHTKLQIKYVAIDPKIEPTPEQIKAEYDKDPTKYQIPEKKTVQYVSVSLAPPKPAAVDEVITKARAGGDFAELATKNSQAESAAKGGEMDWTEEYKDAPPNVMVMLKTPVGTVTDPIESGGAYWIYKVEEEKTDPASGKRSVKAREIMIKEAALDDRDKADREQKAADIAAKATDAKDLKKAADEAQLPVQEAADVSTASTEIAGIPREDFRAFRAGALKPGLDEISEVIKGAKNLYVAQVKKIEPPVPQPLEAVQDKVKENTIEAIRRSSEHQDQVKALAEKVASECKSLAEIPVKFPNLNDDGNPVEIKESQDFTRKDFLIQGAALQTVNVFDAVGKKEPGAFAGPLRGIRGQQCFIELAKKTPPTDEDWKDKWPKEEVDLRKSSLDAKKGQLVMDYLADLRQRMASVIVKDNDVINKMLTPAEEEASDEDKPAEDKPATDNKAQQPAPPMPAAPAKPDLGPPASE